MVEATYALLEYIADLVESIATVEFDPGDPGAETSDTSFANYKLVPNRDYAQPYIHMDALTIKLYHENFESLQKMLNLINGALNNENVADNPALMAAGIAEDVRFQDVICNVRDHTQNDFIDSTEYHVGLIDIMMQYIEL